MFMRMTSEALRAYPPTALTKTTVTGTSSAAIAIGSAGFHLFGVESSANTGVYVLFGASDVAAASSANGLKLAPGDSLERYIPTSVTHYRVIAVGSNEVFYIGKTGD
jgi:hypothetical protein